MQVYNTGKGLAEGSFFVFSFFFLSESNVEAQSKTERKFLEK